jgi:hypothetical protein
MFKKLLVFVSFFVLILLFADSASIALNSPAIGIVWDVNPSMSRSYIQGVIDAASSGDTIFFHAGTYDWSNTPLSSKWDNTGAIVITDKTLTIKGETGTCLIGPESVDGTGGNAQGVNAFRIIDLDTNNDVTFDRLSFQTFLRGISCGYLSYHDPISGNEIFLPNVRNLTVKNCTFSEIPRQSIAISNIGGNVLVQNNVLVASYVPVFVDWYWSPGNSAWQPENTCIRILDNDVTSGQMGLIFQQGTNVNVTNNKISARDGITMDSRGAVIAGNSLTDCFSGMDLWGGLHGAVIERNELTNIADYGIQLYASCQGNIVSKNKLKMSATSWGGIVSNANNNFYGQNSIWGTGSTAFYLYGDSSGSANHETIQANNVDNFAPSWCHFCLDPLTHDNLIIGSGMDHNTYWDDGANNRITGVTLLPGGIGQDLSDAIHLRNEQLKQAKKVIY